MGPFQSSSQAPGFNGRLRDECLNATWFRTLNDVRCTLAIWREEYDCERPHSSLDYRTPNEFRKTLEGRGAMAPLPSPTTTINTTEKTLVMNGEKKGTGHTPLALPIPLRINS